MSKIFKPDLCVIGAGSGGLSVAAGAAAFGVPVVLIEKGAMGGECLNTGCVPSKSLIAAARRAEEVRDAGSFGISSTEPKISFQKVHDHVHRVIASIAPVDSAERFRALGVKVIAGEAHFIDRRTVEVGNQRIQARRFVIATGSQPAWPAVANLSRVPHYTNESIFRLTRAPRDLAILGAGSTGLELAQAYARLGSRVTVFEAAGALGREDPELTALVLDALTQDGVELRLGAKVSRVERARRGVKLFIGDTPGSIDRGEEEEVVEASHLLIATGRRPRLRGLGLEEAGIDFDAGGIRVDASLRTSNRRVFAVGDVLGPPASTHAANYQAGIVLRNVLFRLGAKADYRHIPRVTFTEPELAQVGLTEAEAKARHRKLRIIRWPYAENDRARTERQVAGHIKVIATPRGRVLGAGLVGPQAGELIQVWSLAVTGRLNMRQMLELVPAYPTFGEISRRVAIEFYKPSLTRPLLRRIIKFVRLFG